MTVTSGGPAVSKTGMVSAPSVPKPSVPGTSKPLWKLFLKDGEPIAMANRTSLCNVH